MNNHLVTLIAMFALVSLQAQGQGNSAEVEHRVEISRVVLSEIEAITDTRVPSRVRSQANCVAVFPVTNAHSEVGPEGSRLGIASCKSDGEWSAPVFLRMTFPVRTVIGAGPDIVLIGIGTEILQDLSQTHFSLEQGTVTPGPVSSGYTKGGSEPVAAGFLAYGVKNAQVKGLDVGGLQIFQDEAAESLMYGPGVQAGKVLSGKAPISPWAIPLLRIISEIFR